MARGSLSSLHDDDYAVPGYPDYHGAAANDARATTQRIQAQHHDRRNTQRYEAQGRFTAREDPVHSSRRALGGAKMPASDLNNVNRLYVLLATVVGVVLAVVMIETGINSKNQAAWMKLPGDLYMNAMLCVIVPTVFFNSVLASMHFYTLNKSKALGAKMFMYFIATTLWASIMGTLVAVCFIPLFSQHNLTRAVNSVAVGKAPVSLRCPSKNTAVVFSETDGSLRCQSPADASSKVNGTLFLLQDLSNSFRIRNDPRDVLSLSDAVIQLFESFFPANVLQSFLQGDVLSVIIIGVALGMALIHKSTIRTRENTPGFRTPGLPGGVGGGDGGGAAWAGQLFVLIMQCEVILSVLLRFLLRVMPAAMVHIVAGGILEANALAPDDASELTPSAQDFVTLFGVILFALLLEMATVLAMAMMITKSNPLKFMKHLIPAQLVALGSSSSLVALPTTVRSIATTKQVSMPLAHFVCSTGIVLNKNGSALYLSVVSIYILVTSGLRDQTMSAVNIVLMALVGALCSCVVPPMPRGNLVIIATILSSLFGIHDSQSLVRMVAFLTTMDWLIDPFVTAVNVTNNCLISLILAVQMDESFIEHGMFDADVISDTQEEDSNDGFPLDESRLRSNPAMRATANGAPPPARTGAYSSTVRPPTIERMTSVGESVISSQ